MKTLKLKSILFSLMAVLAIAIVMTSCEQTITETITEDGIEAPAYRLDQLVNETAEPLSASMEQMTVFELNDSTIESRNACEHLNDEWFGCDVYVNCAYHCYYNAYVAWFYNQSEVNRINMQTAYCDYLLAHNYCYGGNAQCP